MMGDGVVMERARIGEGGSTGWGGAEGAAVVVKRATLDPPRTVAEICTNNA